MNKSEKNELNIIMHFYHPGDFYNFSQSRKKACNIYKYTLDSCRREERRFYLRLIRWLFFTFLFLYVFIPSIFSFDIFILSNV